jgi:hypothetical protein
VANLEWWFSSEATYITLNGADVSQWSDRSGNGRHLLQATAADQPLYVASGGPNNAPYVEFDGVSEYLRGTWVLAQPVHVFAVALPTVGGGVHNTYLWDGGAANAMGAIFVNPAPTTTISYYAGVGFVFADCQTAQWQGLECAYNGASSYGRTDTTWGLLRGNIGANTTAGLTLSNLGSGPAGPSYRTNCRIAEMWAYSRVLTIGEIIELEAYRWDKYGI